jgi:hypothetical protein
MIPLQRDRNKVVYMTMSAHLYSLFRSLQKESKSKEGLWEDEIPPQKVVKHDPFTKGSKQSCIHDHVCIFQPFQKGSKRKEGVWGNEVPPLCVSHNNDHI